MRRARQLARSRRASASPSLACAKSCMPPGSRCARPTAGQVRRPRRDPATSAGRLSRRRIRRRQSSRATGGSALASVALKACESTNRPASASAPARVASGRSHLRRQPFSEGAAGERTARPRVARLARLSTACNAASRFTGRRAIAVASAIPSAGAVTAGDGVRLSKVSSNTWGPQASLRGAPRCVGRAGGAVEGRVGGRTAR